MASIPEALRAAGRPIKVVHRNETNHYRLGAGHTDYGAIIRSLKEIGFAGWVSVYMPFIAQKVQALTSAGSGRSVARPDLLNSLAQQLSFLNEIEHAVEAQMTLCRT